MMSDRDMVIGTYALRAAIAEDFDAAGAALKTLRESDGILSIALAWVDSMLAYLTDEELEVVTLPPAEGYEAGRILSQRDGSDEVEQFTDSPPEVQWAAKFLFARARNDVDVALDMWKRQTDEEYPRHFWAVLLVCASNIKRAKDNGIKPRQTAGPEGDR